jgi:hypothetical protein
MIEHLKEAVTQLRAAQLSLSADDKKLYGQLDDIMFSIEDIIDAKESK